MKSKTHTRILMLTACLFAFLSAGLAQTGAASNPRDGQSAAPAASPLADALKALESRGIIKSSDYWLANAVPGKTCVGERVGELIINTAAFKKPTITTREEACDYLNSQGVLSRPDDWKKHARKGLACTGKNVAALIIAFAAFTQP